MDGDGDEGEVYPHPDMAAAALIMATVSSVSASSIVGRRAKTLDWLQWLTYLENWIRYKNLTPKANRLFPLLFRNQAAAWFESLVDDQKDTFEHLQEAFQTRYSPNDLSWWPTMFDMRTRKQNKSESTDKYVTALMKMARIADAEDRDIQRYATWMSLQQF